MEVGDRLRDRFVVERALEARAGRGRWTARDERGAGEVELWTLAVGDPIGWLAAMAKARGVPGVRRVLEHGCDGHTAWVAYAAAQPGPRVGAPMPFEHVVGWVRAVAAGLEAAQRAGWIHGALVVDDVVRVGAELRVGGVGVWTGLDRAAWGDERWQLAPEVRTGGASTAATDVWSMALGAARLAFGDHGAHEALVARAKERGAGIGALVEAALADEPAGRPTVSGFVEALVGIAREPQRVEAIEATDSVEPTMVEELDAVTVVRSAPSAPVRMVAVSARAEPPKAARLQAVSMAAPAKPRVTIRPISEAMPTAFSTREGALGYLAPPAPPRVAVGPRPLRSAMATRLGVAAVAIAAVLALALVVALLR